MLLIPYRFTRWTMDRTLWIIRGPSELVPPMLKLAMWFIIWQWSSTENYLITHCVTIMQILIGLWFRPVALVSIITLLCFWTETILKKIYWLRPEDRRANYSINFHFNYFWRYHNNIFMIECLSCEVNIHTEVLDFSSDRLYLSSSPISSVPSW